MSFATKMRTRGCPLSGTEAPKVDYKNLSLLRRFISHETGKMLPSRITRVCPPKQRELSKAIKRARHLGLLPFVASE